MPRGIYIRTKKTRRNIGKASKGRNSYIWYINKYGKKEGDVRFKKWSLLRSYIAKNQDHSYLKNKKYEEIYGIEKANKIKNKLIKSHTGFKQTIETRLKRSKSSKGRIVSEKTRQKQSITRTLKILSGEITISSKVGSGKGGFRKDIGHYVRSTYEYIFSKFLKKLNISYEYERKHFRVIVDNEIKSFTPDFKIDNNWYEIKNSYNIHDAIFKKKVKYFKENYKNEKIYLIIGNNNENLKDWKIIEEQEDLVEILVKLSPLAVIKN